MNDTNEIRDGTLDLGAMNLDYIKVKKVIKTVESEYNLQVSLKQITSLEWETWFENNHSTSVEKIQKSSVQNQVLEKNSEFKHTVFSTNEKVEKTSRKDVEKKKRKKKKKNKNKNKNKK